MVNSYHYSIKNIDGEDAICFNQDELRTFIIQHAHSDFTVKMWHDLLKKKFETVILTHTEFVALERRITKSPHLLSEFKWGVMVASDLYMKEEPNYLGEIPICFTFFQLATTFLHRTGLDLKWKDWKDLVKLKNIPLTGAFMSASLDFSMPLSLPKSRSYTINMGQWL